MGRTLTVPSKRLAAAAQLAAAKLYSDEKSPYIAIDVGCDHAKLSIYLIQSGLCSHVYACDIADGPVNKAIQNVKNRKFKSESLENYIDVIKTDGLDGLENAAANRIFILGMGGEVISQIISRAGFLFTPENKGKIALILNPMTSQDFLRKYLFENGFNIKNEILVEDCGRIYTLICAVFDGVKREQTDIELLLGMYIIKNGGPLFEKQLERQVRITRKAIEQRTRGGLDSKDLEKLYLSLILLKEKKNDDCKND